MKKVLSEINRYRQLLGLTLLEDVKPADEYENEIAEILKKENVYTKEVEELLYNVLDMGFNETINFDLLERNVRNVLMKKGDKKKNVTKYFENIIKALKKRKKEDFTSNEPDFEEFSFEPEEPSLIKKKVYRDELYHLQVELLKMQEWVKKTGKTVIIVFEGRDSAGKGSTIKKFTENLNPRYYNIIALGIPTPEERKAWWDRYRNQIQKGMINFFDRSWYNRGLVEPVMGYGSAEEYEDFMENVEGFEKDLVKDGDYLFKLWFSIDKETQANRFQMRQQSPLKYWKYSPNDEKMQDMWERFTEFKQKLFDKTSTVNHPWVILDANDKRVSGLNAIRYVLQNIPYEGKNKEVLNKEFPEAMTILKPEVNEQKIKMPDITAASDSTMTKYDKPQPIVKPIEVPEDSNLQDGTKMKVSQEFWDHIKYAEGLAKLKGKPALQAYKDSVGVATIGWGHTGDDVRMGMTIDETKALKLLYNDAKEFADCVRNFLSEWKSKGLKSYMLTQGQFDALVSLAFNAGCGGVRQSDFIQSVKKGDHKKAAEQIRNFKTLGLQGLVNRRNAEAEMYLNSNYNVG